MAQSESSLAPGHTLLGPQLEQVLVATVRQEVERRSRSQQDELKTALLSKSSLEAVVSQLQQKLAVVSDENQKLHFKVEELAYEVSSRAYVYDLREVQETLQTLCPLHKFERLRKSVEELAKAEEVTALTRKYKATKTKMHNTFFAKEEAQQYFETLREELELLASQCCSKNDLNRLNAKVLKRVSYVTQELSEVKQAVSAAVSSVTNNLEHLKNRELPAKADIADFQELAHALKQTLSLEAFDEFRKEAQLDFLRFNVDSLVVNVNAQEQALLRLDELLLEKCSKIDLHGLRSQLETVWKHIGLEDRIDDVLLKMTQFEEFTKLTRIELSQVKTELYPLASYYQKKIDIDSRLKHVQDAVLSCKAELDFKPDRSEVYELLDQKGSADEQKKLSEAVNEHKSNIMMIVSQISAMQRIVADPARSLGTEKLQREFLSKATKKMSEIILSPRALAEERKGSTQYIIKSRTQTPRRKLRLRGVTENTDRYLERQPSKALTSTRLINNS